MKYGIIGNEYYTDENVYWRLFNSGKQSRIKRVEDFALKGLNQYKADNTKYDNSAVNVTLKDYYIYKRIEVEINIKYKAPFGSFLKLFMEYPYPIHAKGVAAVSEPAEMIRTIDFGYDILLENKIAANAISKYQEGLAKLKKQIGG